MSQIRIDTRELRALENRLERLYEKALPFAQIQANNALAFDGMGSWRARTRNVFTLRNQFTVRSIQVQKATKYNKTSELGSTAKYMPIQEHGGIKRSKSGRAPAVPTDDARIGRDHKRLVSGSKKARNIQIARGRRAGSRRQRNAAAIRQAVSDGNKFVHLDMGRTRGIFEIRGKPRRRLRSGLRSRRGGIKLRMLHDLSKPERRIPKKATLAPTIERLKRRGPGIYKQVLIKEIEKQIRLRAGR